MGVMMIDIGPFFFTGGLPPLTADERELIARFHDLYYRRWPVRGGTISLSWFGHLLLKCPMDLWIYQELLVEHRPDFVIETGTHEGGSALFFAMMLDHLENGEVFSIDLIGAPRRPVHPRIPYITGSSIDPAVVADVKERVAGRRAMVILDSNHRADHVFAEIEAYRSLVQVDDYLVVEDTNINGHPAFPGFGPGPMEAVERFLAANDEFAIDPRCERFLMTLNPNGYLRRIKPAPLPAE